ncbi:MAG: S26 family signal peptidase [Pseudobacteriovorax sp.]|nr:S26 family signal peptidase [Pseudobacteriovorax sp.]
MFKLYRVEGKSLEPKITETDLLLGIRPVIFGSFSLPKAKKGDIIVFKKPGYPKMVKEVSMVSVDQYVVIGFHDDSIDSRHFGVVYRSEVCTRIVWIIRGALFKRLRQGLLRKTSDQ